MKISIIAGLCVIAALASCSGNNGQQAAVTAADNTVADAAVTGKWNIDNIVLNDTTGIRPGEQVPGVEQYILFTDSTFFINTNCNSISGSYTVNGDSIMLGAGPMTEMACDNMATEDALRQILPGIATVSMENDSVMRLNGASAAEYIVLTRSTSAAE